MEHVSMASKQSQNHVHAENVEIAVDVMDLDCGGTTEATRKWGPV